MKRSRHLSWFLTIVVFLMIPINVQADRGLSVRPIVPDGEQVQRGQRLMAVGIDPATFDLSVKNSNNGEEIVHRSLREIMDEIAALDAESAEVLANIRISLSSAEGRPL